MAPRFLVDIVILRLSFIPHIDPLYPRINFTRKRHSPGGSVTQVRDWFDRIIARELAQIPDNLKVQFSEWKIMTGNANIFTVDGQLFDKIMVIMGEQRSYWIFFQNMPQQLRLEGSASLPLTYCACCLNNQYLKVMETIKQCMANTDT